MRNVIRFVGSLITGLLITAALVGAFALASCSHAVQYRSERDFDTDLAVDVSGGRPLTLVADFRHGSMAVTGSDDGAWHLDAEVTVYSWDRDVAQLVAEELEVVAERSGDRIVVRVAPASGRWDPDDYHIGVRSRFRVPRTTSLDVATTHGALRFESLRGTIRARSTHGAIKLYAIDGDTDVRSTHGTITADTLRGASHVLTSTHGGATLTGVTGTLVLTTSHGAVDADLGLQTRGDSVISTTHGAVVVRLSPESDATVTASTSHGRISCDLPVTASELHKTRGRAVLGEGGATITVRTSHGAVRIAESSEAIGRKAE